MISRLSKRSGGLQALDSLSLTLDDHELVGFVGANGAGKSTTMRIVMGALAPDAGAVTWNGAPVDAATTRSRGSPWATSSASSSPPPSSAAPTCSSSTSPSPAWTRWRSTS